MQSVSKSLKSVSAKTDVIFDFGASDERVCLPLTTILLYMTRARRMASTHNIVYHFSNRGRNERRLEGAHIGRAVDRCNLRLSSGRWHLWVGSCADTIFWHLPCRPLSPLSTSASPRGKILTIMEAKKLMPVDDFILQW
jgi:hypothetical protein